MSKIVVNADQVTVRGYRRQGRSPRKLLVALRAQNAEALVERLGKFRNERRQARVNARGAA